MRGWLKETRNEKGLTAKEVSDKLNISESYYSFIESGQRQKKMDLTLAAKISTVLDIPIETILAEEAR